jgi:hypothetical protein
MEADSNEVVETLAADEVLLIGVVAPGVLVRKIRIAVDEALDLAEIADRGEGSMNSRSSQGVRRSCPAISSAAVPLVPAMAVARTRACGSGQPARP